MIRIHKEGALILTTIFLSLIVINILIHYITGNITLAYILIGLSLVLVLFALYFFRNPVRDFNIEPNSVISPADGEVVVIEEVKDIDYFNGKRVQVSVFMSVLNVHVNRWPIAGVIKYYRYFPGRFYAAFLPKASTDNEHSTIVVEHASGKEVMIKQIAGALARRIVTYANEGEHVVQNDDLGFIRFGSRVDLLLPLDSTVNVKIGDKVEGGITRIASL